MFQDTSRPITISSTKTIPVLLLKTHSQPHDTYAEYFAIDSKSSTSLISKHESLSVDTRFRFEPQFIPVLEHERNEETLTSLGQLLKSRRLKECYGGMIFTSQRAVEGWADVVRTVEEEVADGNEVDTMESDVNKAIDTRTGSTFTTDILSATPFPLYVVGPATARSLDTLLSLLQPPTSPSHSPFLALNPIVHGSQTGSGAALAPFILSHYNAFHSRKWFTYHDAPRLPFIPLLGMGSENYSRRRLEPDDPRLQKSPLLFLVGETRRDIIPKTLMDPRLGAERIEVEEVEVYKTVVRTGFREDFQKVIEGWEMGKRVGVVVVVVFSPQGSGDMLRALGLVDEEARVTEKYQRRWTGSVSGVKETKYVIVTIGPTTCDHLVNTFGFEPDVCAKKPSPEGVGEGLMQFLKEKGLV